MWKSYFVMNRSMVWEIEGGQTILIINWSLYSDHEHWHYT